MNAVIEMVPINQIEDNPLRRKGKYPFNENKVEVLMHSMSDPDVGCWEGIIGRRNGKRTEQAFGHHRKEAGKRLGLKTLPVIIRDLTDEQMLKFFGRENLEDYNADFSVMLQTWEATEEWMRKRFHDREKNPQASEIARFLGWTRPVSQEKKPGVFMYTPTAEACSLASKLIAGGHTSYEVLDGLSVSAVRDLCGRIIHQHEQLEKMAKTTGRPAAETNKAKQIVNRAGASVAKKVRAGTVAPRNIRKEVDRDAFIGAAKSKARSPLFATFGRSLADQIATIAESDYLADRFNSIKQAIDAAQVSEPEDFDVLNRIGFECGEASTRFSRWHKVFDKPDKRIVPMRAVEDKR